MIKEKKKIVFVFPKGYNEELTVRFDYTIKIKRLNQL